MAGSNDSKKIELGSLLQQYKKFHALQAERVETYALFDEGFQAYLRGAPQYNFEMYKKLIHEITDAFYRISNDIISIQKSMTENGFRNIASIIENIQSCEQEKLKLTAELQIKQQNVIDEPMNVQHKEEVQTLQQRLKESVETINEYMESLKYEAEDLYDLEQT